MLFILGWFQCCSRNADCGFICLWPWNWPSQSAFVCNFSKSWGSFYVKGVLSSFVIFGGLVSNFFDVAYPGVQGCVSLCSGIIMVWLGSPGFASSLELDNCFFVRCFSFRWRSCKAWVLDYEKVVSGYQLIRSVGHPVLASFSPLN